VVRGRSPLCFVVMPFGTKRDAAGDTVDFDGVYERLLRPAACEAGLEPLRADQELIGGVIHKPMFERLVLADYAIADLTTANPNVFYELGVRHGVRPYSTVLVGAETKLIPFDLAPDRVLPYRLDAEGLPAEPEQDRRLLVEALRAAREASVDSPVFQLIGDLSPPDIERLKTDHFRSTATYSAEMKALLASAREEGVGAVRGIAADLGSTEDLEAGVLVDLLLAYRATGAWEEMVSLVGEMTAPLRRTVLIREQYAFALNRTGRSADAERVLREVLDEQGPRSETFGLLGRVYKDRWEATRKSSALTASGYLDQAIDAYRSGFEADWRDAYPGVNAVTLMEIREPGGTPQQVLVPVVGYGIQRRIAGGRADYWDHASKLELDVVVRDREGALRAAGSALATVREPWEAETTAHNLSLIRESRAQNDEEPDWADEIERELKTAALADQKPPSGAEPLRLERRA